MPRFICPHCHSPLEPRTMDRADDAKSQLRICPNCDEPIVLAAASPMSRIEAGNATTSSVLAAHAKR